MGRGKAAHYSYTCEDCGGGFRGPQGLGAHRKSAHGKESARGARLKKFGSLSVPIDPEDKTNVIVEERDHVDGRGDFVPVKAEVNESPSSGYYRKMVKSLEDRKTKIKQELEEVEKVLALLSTLSRSE